MVYSEYIEDSLWTAVVTATVTIEQIRDITGEINTNIVRYRMLHFKLPIMLNGSSELRYRILLMYNLE